MADNYIGEGFGDSLNPSEERIRQLEEEIRRLKEEREASTHTESYTAANGVERKAVQLPYRPSEEQVLAYMVNILHLREDVAEEEARKFLRYNDGQGWKLSGTTALNWNVAVGRWVSRAEERQGISIYAPQLTEEQQQEEERKREEREIDAEARACLERISYRKHGGFAGEGGAKARKVHDAILAGESSEDRFGRVVKRTGALWIDLLAWTYAEIIIMENYEHAGGGDYAKIIKDRIDSGVPFTSWFWHGMEMKVIFYLERWYKGPGRPLKRLVPIKIGATKTKAQRDVPELWKYYKTKVERRDISGGSTGPIVKKLIEKVEKEDFSGQFGDIAEWIATGKVPEPQPPETPSDETQGGDSKPLKGIVNAAMRNMGRQT